MNIAISCPMGLIHQSCQKTCGLTCMDVAKTDIACPKEQDLCLEGCQCPANFKLDSKGHCIPLQDCPCLSTDNQLYEVSFKMFFFLSYRYLVHLLVAPICEIPTQGASKRSLYMYKCKMEL